MKTRIKEKKLHFRTSMWVPIVAIVRSMPTFIPTLRPVPNNNNPLLPLSLSVCVRVSRVAIVVKCRKLPHPMLFFLTDRSPQLEPDLPSPLSTVD